MVISNFPHNPTSWMPTLDEHVELIRLCESAGALLFSDEMYWGSILGQANRPISSCVRYRRAITLSGLSKPYGMPGLRLGWLATQDAEVNSKIAQMKDYVTICGSAPSEILGIIALRHGDAILARSHELQSRSRDLLKSFCAEFSEILEWAPEPSIGITAF